MNSYTEKPFGRRTMLPVALIYFLSGLFLIGLDLGSHPWGLAFSGLMERIIPSIASTASFSTSPHNARLVLALAWLTIAVYAVVLIAYDRGKSFRWEFINKNKWKMVFAVLFGPFLVAYLAVLEMTPLNGYAGYSARFYYSIISSSPIILLLFETTLVLVFALALYTSFCLPIEFFRRIFLREITHDDS